VQFPRLVYKAADVHTLAEDAEEFEALLAEGWFATVPEALGLPEEVKPVETPKPQAAKPASAGKTANVGNWASGKPAAK